MDYPQDDLIVTERVAIVAWDLALGTALTTAEIADRTGLTANGVHKMMSKVARVRPVMLWDGEWQRTDGQEWEEEGEEQ